MKTKGPGFINFVKPGQKAKGVPKNRSTTRVKKMGDEGGPTAEVGLPRCPKMHRRSVTEESTVVADDAKMLITPKTDSPLERKNGFIRPMQGSHQSKYSVPRTGTKDSLLGSSLWK